MPVHIKLMVSAITLVVGGGFFFFEKLYGDSNVALVGGCLAIFMVVAMWVFPEVGQKQKRR